MAKEEKAEKSDKDKEVRIYSIATTQNECIIFLEEATGDRLLPIWIGLNEGQAIAIRFSGVVLPRPLTHDLIVTLVKTLGWTVEKVVVNDIKENTFYARVHLKKEDGECTVDARPSDAIAVAVRAGCSIFVSETVFAKCQVLTKPISEDEVSKFKEELKNLKPEDIFKDIKDKPFGGEKKPPKKEKGKDKEKDKDPDKDKDDE